MFGIGHCIRVTWNNEEAGVIKRMKQTQGKEPSICNMHQIKSKSHRMIIIVFHIICCLVLRYFQWIQISACRKFTRNCRFGPSIYLVLIFLFLLLCRAYSSFPSELSNKNVQIVFPKIFIFHFSPPSPILPEYGTHTDNFTAFHHQVKPKC